MVRKLSNIDRRRFIKNLSAVGIPLSSVGLSGLATASKQEATADEDEWDCNNGCPQKEVKTTALDLPDPTGSSEKLEGGISIHWKESGYSSSKGKWYHIFSVSGGAASETSGVAGGHIYGQHYKLKTSDGDIQPSTEGDKHGQFPCDDNDEFIPGWGQPLVKAAIGTVSIGLSWFLAVDEALRSKLGHRPDGFDIFSGGFEYGDMATSLTSPLPWLQSTFFHRVELETDEYSPTVNVKMGFCHHSSPASTLWKEFKGELEFFGSSGDPEISPMGESDPHPDKMSQEAKDKYGIKEVSDQEASISTQSSGEEVTFDYIATNCPLSDKKSEVIEVAESEMDEARSERIRDRLDKPAPYSE
ncbi:hypothetical protein [Haloferax sp. Atlit-12N]|uniref:hypothetical protein n=1 Tax=Haloferax sp. Atlit-12N TaxID=2077203 RepID=UPI0011E5F7DC|nr:hypothetical protein [Haloferax sp. Atlit-12N]